MPLRVGESPLADLDGVEPGPIEEIPFIEVDDLLRFANVDPGQAPDREREVAVGARKVVAPKRNAVCQSRSRPR